MLLLHDPIIDHIFSFFHPYKHYYTTHVLVNLKSRLQFNVLIKQLRSFSVYNKEKHLIKFYKYNLLKTVHYKCDEKKVRNDDDRRRKHKQEEKTNYRANKKKKI